MKFDMVFMGFFIFAIAAYLIVSGCVQQQARDAPLDSDKFIFVEHSSETLAQVVGDSDIYAAYPYLGYNTFYNTITDPLQSSYFPYINDSLKVYFINWSSVGPVGCHGSSVDSYGVYDFPLELDNFAILNANNTGTAFIVYNDENLTLSPGENHTSVISRIEDVHFMNGTVNKTISINITVIDKITNYGLCNKT